MFKTVSKYANNPRMCNTGDFKGKSAVGTKIMNNAASCRCCLSRAPDQHLSTGHKRSGICEAYTDMLNKCFDIQLKVGLISGDAGICNVCVGRLRDALNFKNQVLQCQRDFEAVVNNALTIKVEGPKIKREAEEDDDNNDAFLELKSESGDKSSDEDRKSVSLLAVKRNKQLTARPKGPEAKVHQIAVKAGRVVQLQPARPVPRPSPKILQVANSRLPEYARLQMDADLLYKYSNATPFNSKSITGIICQFCYETLPTMAALRDHTREQHKSEKIPIKSRNNSLKLKMDIIDLQCKLCNAEVDFISTLKKHLTEQHNIRFQSVKNYIVEFKLTDSDPMNCARCNSNFETFKALVQHMGRHYRNFECEKCAAGFINLAQLRLHMTTHEAGSHKCSICTKVFRSPTHLRDHEKSHTSKKIVKCPHCDQIFHSYYVRNSHMLKVHNTAAATYKCNICDRDFVVKHKLTLHIKKDHLMERNHKCKVCGKAFFSQQRVAMHMVTHSGDKAYQCAECNKAFARKYTLREHMRIHANDRRFQCGMCGLKFVQKCSLKGHMMSNHNLALSECRSENDVYTCKSSPDDKPAK